MYMYIHKMATKKQITCTCILHVTHFSFPPSFLFSPSCLFISPDLSSLPHSLPPSLPLTSNFPFLPHPSLPQSLPPSLPPSPPSLPSSISPPHPHSFLASLTSVYFSLSLYFFTAKYTCSLYVSTWFLLSSDDSSMRTAAWYLSSWDWVVWEGKEESVLWEWRERDS